MRCDCCHAPKLGRREAEARVRGALSSARHTVAVRTEERMGRPVDEVLYEPPDGPCEFCDGSGGHSMSSGPCVLLGGQDIKWREECGVCDGTGTIP